MAERPSFVAIARRNARRSWGLLAATVVLLWLIIVAVGVLGFGSSFVPSVIVSLVIAVGYLFFAQRAASRTALRMAGAHPAVGDEFLMLRNVVEEMAIAAGLPVPEVWVINDAAPNAFAAGHRPEKAVVAVTTGLLSSLSRAELKGVVAHEMAHIRNRDIAVTTISVVTVSAIMLLADLLIRIGFYSSMGRRSRSNDRGATIPLALIGFAILIVGLPLAIVLRAALSRSRESLADATAVELTRDPSGIRSALEKLEADTREIRRMGAGMNSMWIESPADKAHGPTKFFAGLTDTHPPISERIEILRAMEGLPAGERGPNDAFPAPSGPAQAF